MIKLAWFLKEFFNFLFHIIFIYKLPSIVNDSYIFIFWIFVLKTAQFTIVFIKNIIEIPRSATSVINKQLNDNILWVIKIKLNGLAIESNNFSISIFFYLFSKIHILIFMRDVLIFFYCFDVFRTCFFHLGIID